jgi:hypothetical protein
MAVKDVKYQNVKWPYREYLQARALRRSALEPARPHPLCRENKLVFLIHAFEFY